MSVVEEIIVLRPTDDVLDKDSLQAAVCLAEEADTQIVHLDLGRIRLPTAEGLGVLAALGKELRACGGTLVLLNVAADVYGVFAVTHLVEVLDVRPAFPTGTDG
jgi:hypothetical protein